MKISQGSKPPRSGIEIELGDLLAKRHSNHYDTSISWIRSHIGIKGNEEADWLAALASARGQFTVQEPLVTEGGIRQASKASRMPSSTRPTTSPRQRKRLGRSGPTDLDQGGRRGGLGRSRRILLCHVQKTLGARGEIKHDGCIHIYTYDTCSSPCYFLRITCFIYTAGLSQAPSGSSGMGVLRRFTIFILPCLVLHILIYNLC